MSFNINNIRKNKISKMTIGGKLRFVNALMLFVPMLFAIIGIALIYLVFVSGDINNVLYYFKDTSNVNYAYSGCNFIYDEFKNQLLTTGNDNILNIMPPNNINNEKTFVRLTKNNKIIFETAEDEKPENFEKLLNLVSSSEKKQFTVIGDTLLFKGIIEYKGNMYTIISSGVVKNVFTAKKTNAFYLSWFLTNLLFIILVVVGVYILSKFFYKSIFKRLKFSLDSLSNGVEKVSDGNLDYQIVYEMNDEFKPICDKFNLMTDKLKESIELIQKQEKIRKEIIMSISHDIFSPLTSIKAYCEGIENGIASTEETKQKYLEVIKSKANQIESIVSQLLLYSKLEYEDFAPNNEKVNLAEFLENYIKTVDADYSLKNIQISIEKNEKSVVYADRALLSRLFTNIIDNSGKYSDKPVCHISFSLKAKENSCIISICDDGPGVPQDNIEHIFEVFYRSDSARNKTNMGSGIGLSIVNNIVTKSLNGNIKAQNRTSGGLEIIIEIPTITKE